jgi:hypothetical protein
MYTLLESGLGQSYSPGSGFYKQRYSNSHLHCSSHAPFYREGNFGIGLEGMKLDDVETAKQKIYDILHKLAEGTLIVIYTAVALLMCCCRGI